MEKPPKTRVCKKCGRRKVLVEFEKNKECRFGYGFICKECINAEKRQLRKEKPELYKQYDNTKYKKHGNKIRKRLANYYQLNKNKVKTRVNKYRLLNREKINKNRVKDRKLNKWKYCLQGIKARCENKKSKAYKYYGGRGIKNKFKNADEIKFLWFRDKAYLMKKPSIDRIDNDGNYCIENCRFIEFSENIRKRNIERYNKV